MKYLIILFCLITVSINAQIYMEGVEPLNPGNLWKYFDVWSDLKSNFFVTDSMKTIGEYEYNVVEVYQDGSTTRHKRYLGLTPDSFYIKYDTLAEDSIYRYYKKDSKIGDSWSQRRFTNTYYYTVIDTFTINAWGQRFFSKQLKITDSSLVEVYQLWADSIGLIEENSIGQYDMILRGCVINGIVYGDTSTIVGIEEEIEIPQKFLLSQNYPNPFNPVTNISFYLPLGSEVLLEVYNVLGEKVKTLVNEYRSAGRYTEIFNGAGLPSGIYIYRLTSGNFTASKKLILMK